MPAKLLGRKRRASNIQGQHHQQLKCNKTTKNLPCANQGEMGAKQTKPKLRPLRHRCEPTITMATSSEKGMTTNSSNATCGFVGPSALGGGTSGGCRHHTNGMKSECDETDNNNTNKPQGSPRTRRLSQIYDEECGAGSRQDDENVFEIQRLLRDLDTPDVTVLKLKTWIDKKLTTIDERSSVVLKYRTPHFRAMASIELPVLEKSDVYQVGWIQTCLDMKFINKYASKGITSWEFPEIVSGKYHAISDADGMHYPWYGAKTEVRTVRGPSDRQTVSVEMNDNFFPQVTWSIPDPSGQCERVPQLTHVYRKQRFLTYLVLKDLRTHQVHQLRTISWQMELNIDVNPTLPLGSRAHLASPFQQLAPRVLTQRGAIPSYALQAPNANSSQVLVWRPYNKAPHVVVAPLDTTMDMDKYLRDTADLWRNYSAIQSDV